MQCPFCHHTDSRVLESRSAEAGQSVRRRRECLHCDRRFTTYERIEFVPISVIKRNGDRESFDRSKLLRGIVTACEKTGISSHAIETLVDEIEADLQLRSLREVASAEIGEAALTRLRQLSEVAYVRFASVYRQFQGISDFVEELDFLKQDIKQNIKQEVKQPLKQDQDNPEDHYLARATAPQ
ncbi:transcriptional regulator NrdR [Candidatus Synechococcus calcipolaris G9]|uniref:Transcriptional repressor NrdR n=1 Tax=Candidatus Synechococcus calcipolaris G9 TaxID=1497997 RepID=A0ABT6EYL5_9SYNE|nr:transcriptional regulator NrdR [Candidatus Synechococcus calcipolaris]MDG2990198.1 transcriptional regulator NrdR [Candidatus Synechococcus calcipolaris G9]